MIVNFGVVERTHPQVEVQVGRNRHFGQVEWSWRVANACMNLLDIADAAATHNCYSLLEFGTAALLAAHLQYAVVCTDGALHSKPFGYGESQRFLQEHILSGLKRMDCHQSMPVVGGCDGNGVDVLALEHAFILFVGVAALGHALFLLPCSYVTAESFALNAVDIAASSNLHARTTAEASEIAAALLSDAHKSHNYAVAWSHSYSTNCEARQNPESCKARGSCGEKTTTRHAIAVVLFFIFFFHVDIDLKVVFR